MSAVWLSCDRERVFNSFYSVRDSGSTLTHVALLLAFIDKPFYSTIVVISADSVFEKSSKNLPRKKSKLL